MGLLLAILASVGAPREDSVSPARIQRHLAEGRRLVREGRFEGAMAEFHRANLKARRCPDPVEWPNLLRQAEVGYLHAARRALGR